MTRIGAFKYLLVWDKHDKKLGWYLLTHIHVPITAVKFCTEQVNLYDARKRKSKTLSGGMRRRLSVAMACIGSPDILILDEPTTGLDPASRRQVWEVIEILITHAMDSNHLCTRIGIMNFGRLHCLGSQNRLKSKFGIGYQLAFNCAPGRVSDVEKFVRNNLWKAVHIETYAGIVCKYDWNFFKGILFGICSTFWVFLCTLYHCTCACIRIS